MFPIIKRLTDIILSLIGLLILAPVLLIVGLSSLSILRARPSSPSGGPGNMEKSSMCSSSRPWTTKKMQTGSCSRIRNASPLPVSLSERPLLMSYHSFSMSLRRHEPHRPQTTFGKIPTLLQGGGKNTLYRTPWNYRLAQVSGRNFMSWDDKFKKDIEYVENMGFSQDLSIFYKTILKVLKSEDIEVDQSANPFMNDLDWERRDMFPNGNPF